ncbi:MAG: hypothetical protein P9L99_19800 [Candidatus Lernaella stagnicola]|nr:hypothetical protein [Candidatus Lernaella stagnicola]
MDHRVTIGRYRGDTGCKGWVETGRWIMFEMDDGTLCVANRRSATGAVIGDITVIPPKSKAA